jgi:lipopolysaccharide transport system permease protein
MSNQTIIELETRTLSAADIRRDAPECITQIRPSRGVLDLEFIEVWRYRELLFVLIKRDIQVLYKQAALGAAWAIIQPVFAVIIFAVVFGYFAKMPSDDMPYPLFAFAALLPWTYFAEAVRRGAMGIVSDAELVRKVYFPRLLMPLAGVVAPFLDFALAFIVLIGLMLWYGVVPGLEMLLVLPLIMVASFMALSVSLWLAPLNVRFRDFQYTIPFLIQVWMYASPIVYPLSLVPAKWKWLVSLNPMVGVIEGFRWAVVPKGAPDIEAIAISLFLIAAFLFGGLIFFKHMERTFADTI